MPLDRGHILCEILISIWMYSGSGIDFFEIKKTSWIRIFTFSWEDGDESLGCADQVRVASDGRLELHQHPVRRWRNIRWSGATPVKQQEIWHVRQPVPHLHTESVRLIEALSFRLVPTGLLDP